MKLLSLPIFVPLLLVASLASAATNMSYTASGDPNLNPDANNGTADAWTVTHGGDAAGNSNAYYGSYYGTGGMLGTAWAIYSNHDYTTIPPAATSEADMNHVFDGGTLNLGQTVSVDFLANSVDTGQQYGIRLMTGGTFVLALSFVGGDAGYRYYDGRTNGTSPFGYQGNGFHFAYTQNTATTYTVVATTIGTTKVVGTFSGTVSGSPDTIQIYNESAGTDNNVLTNNLSVVPEPRSCVLLALGGLLLTGLGVRSRRTV